MKWSWGVIVGRWVSLEFFKSGLFVDRTDCFGCHRALYLFAVKLWYLKHAGENENWLQLQLFWWLGAELCRKLPLGLRYSSNQSVQVFEALVSKSLEIFFCSSIYYYWWNIALSKIVMKCLLPLSQLIQQTTNWWYFFFFVFPRK